ncbi:MAG: hypothetical protein ACRD3N_11055 [Terracidiphilus sp.]
MAVASLGILAAWGQGPAAANGVSNSQDNRAALVVGHPFSAIKYAREVKALPDGKVQFLSNERYPVRIARDADGRLMMQVIYSDDLQPECDHLEMPVPPVCPAWSIFVIDPVAHTVAHWVEGELGAHVWIDFPLSEARLEEAARDTGELPDLAPVFSDQDGKVSEVDLGDRSIEGIQAHGVRWTLRYGANQDGKTVWRTRIHEVWASPEMKLIVRVVDGDPHGVETVWGLKKISLSPDPALFQPPADYAIQHSKTDWGVYDFRYLESWFSK